MAKIPIKLETFRDDLIVQLWDNQEENGLTAQDIGLIFSLSTSTVYKIIKDHKENPNV